MKSVNAAEAQAQLDTILDVAQQQPIAIQREGQHETCEFIEQIGGELFDT
jgi:PHD/YefM family antitoxin component YafN of YafNO toxin-antitoxin module